MENKKRLIDANAYAYPGDLAGEPTVDAVEVVRCKDCKHYCDYGRVWDCRKYEGMHLPNDNDFCSYGERREGD